MFDQIKSDTTSTMDKSIDNFKLVLSKIRAGRPNPSILDQIMIDYFGTNTPIKQLANIAVTDASTISLSIWDKNAVSLIEKALNESNLGCQSNCQWNESTYKVPATYSGKKRRIEKNC